MKKKTQDIINWLNSISEERNCNGFLIDNTKDDLQVLTTKLLCKKCNKPLYSILSEDEDKYTLTKNIIKKANDMNLLVVSTLNAVDINVIRDWNRFCLIADVFPLANENKKSIIDLYYDLIDCNTSEVIDDYNQDKVVFDGNLCITYSEIEDAYELSNKQKVFQDILVLEEPPTKHPFWYALSSRQKVVISYLHQHIKLTEYKVVLLRKIFKI
jgi:hypothetical protein